VITVSGKMKEKTLEWIGSSKKDLLTFPKDVRKEMGHALYIAQTGGKDKNAKPLKGFGGAKVLEIVHRDGNGTYRTMYTVQFEEVVYVLHAFQKKSKTGIKTPKQDIDVVEQRLKWAQEKHQGN
jgi:phage-related protein